MPDGSRAPTTQKATPEQEANAKKLLEMLQYVQTQTDTAQEALELLSACIVEYLVNAPPHVRMAYMKFAIDMIRDEVMAQTGPLS